MLKRRLKEPFGKAGLTVAILALVMAVAGGAYAAGGLTKAQEKQVTKIAKKYAGKPGAPGAPGLAGPAGPAGAAGKEGPAGKNGTDGTNGTNGQTGFTETLPSGKTEKGDWSMGAATSTGFLTSAAGFNIPLAAAPTPVYVKQSESATPPAECPGTVAEPAAEPGFLCVFAEEESEILPSPGPGRVAVCSATVPLGNCVVSAEYGADSSGFVAAAFASTGGLAFGSWAVTAE